jgi:DNA-binding SARP family transcriptional activator
MASDRSEVDAVEVLLAQVRDLLAADAARIAAGAPASHGRTPAGTRSAELAGHAVLAYLSALRGSDEDVARHLGALGELPPGNRASTAPGTIDITTLGTFGVRGTPAPVAWPSRKTIVLLQVLTAHTGRSVSRDVVAEILWPGADHLRQRRRLAVVLSDLRRALDPERAHPIDRFVQSSHGSLALDGSHVRIDVELFRSEATEGLARWRTGDHDTASDLLARAASRYGGAFLPGALYDDWARTVREELRRIQGDVLHTLVDARRRRHDLAGARRATEALVALDPYDDVAHRLLVENLTAAGRHGEARAASQRFRDRMAEIGVAAVG